mmetsp:Transcript_30386/g.43530  ORF Transcript_30386/g.43530 Transcript_30386/m.43530 type:complete len:196 (+) Transcript_30386:266-853(+)
MQERLEDGLARGLQSASCDLQLARALQRLRQDRFEAALRAALDTETDTGDRDALKRHLLLSLGPRYMQQHSLEGSRGAEEGLAVAAYRQLGEERLLEDLAAAADLHLLTRCGEAVEAELQARAQQWVSGEGLGALLAEEPRTAETRAALQQARQQCGEALQRLDHLPVEVDWEGQESSGEVLCLMDSGRVWSEIQ